MAVTSDDFQNIDRAISRYAIEAYTDNRGIMGSELVSTNTIIEPNGEGYYGQLRYEKPLGSIDFTTTQTTTNTHVNRATETTDEGLTTDMSTYTERYGKQYYTIGALEYNMTRVVTQRSGIINKIGNDWANRRREVDNIFLNNLLKGIADHEANRPTGSNRGGQSASNIRSDEDNHGFFYDTHDGTNARAFIDTTSNSTVLDRILEGITYAWGDLGDENVPYYILLSPVDLLKVRQANIFDENGGIVESGFFFNTALQGRLRFFQTGRTLGGDFSSSMAVNTASTKTSFIMRAGAITHVPMRVTNPVAFDNDESRGRGAGNMEIWLRWGQVTHPKGYDYNANPTNWLLPADVDAAANWSRKANVGNLYILPVFHS